MSKTYEFHRHFSLSALSGWTRLTELNIETTYLFVENFLYI